MSILFIGSISGFAITRVEEENEMLLEDFDFEEEDVDIGAVYKEEGEEDIEAEYEEEEEDIEAEYEEEVEDIKDEYVEEDVEDKDEDSDDSYEYYYGYDEEYYYGEE